MASKYGVALTQEGGWKGWPLRVGHFASEGKSEGLVTKNDTVLVWGGGVTNVVLHATRASGSAKTQSAKSERYEFVRRSGSVDLLPRDTVLDSVTWRGEESGCVAVQLETRRVEHLLGECVTLDSSRPLRLAVSDHHIVDLVRRLEAQARGLQPCGDIYVEALSLTLASYVYGRYGSAPVTAVWQAAGLAPVQCEQLEAFIDDHLSERIGLAELARLVGYSPDHFARLFRQSFGRSPYQYLLRRRIDRAKVLLLDRSYSLAEVAMASGFATQAHLNTSFKARTGVTPGAYRKM
jgi:AraC family transcriptional regulator